MGEAAPAPGWYADPSGTPGLRYWDGRQWTAVAPPPATPTNFAARRSPSAVRTIATAVLFVCLAIGAAGCIAALISVDNDAGRTTSRPASSTAPPPSSDDPDDEFRRRITGIPMWGDDPELFARAVCITFKRTPGTSIDTAARQLAASKGWTTEQGAAFVNAATNRYCPEYRAGS